MHAFSYAWSLPITWQRWCHTIPCTRTENSMLHASVMALCFIDEELRPIAVLHCGNTHFRHFCSCDLHLHPMTFAYKLDPHSIPHVWKWISYVNAFESYCTITACECVHFRSRDKDGGWHHSIRHCWKPMIDANLICLLQNRSYERSNCGNRYFRFFCSCDLDLDPMTFI